MHFERILHSKIGKILISIILGLGLATLFKKTCNGRNCYSFIGPKMNDIKNKQYKFNNDCYKFKEKAVSCDKEKKTLYFS
tara:strand:+ start:8740 stop:8979 length:240 start_codon:yes stop_codon:yes gene_type:complete